MNNNEQTVFNTISDTVIKNIEFNSNGLKFIVNTPKCCKKVIINENVLENKIQSCNADCFDSEYDGKSMTCESECSHVQETIKKTLVKKGNDNDINTDRETGSEVGSILKKSVVGNVVSEEKSKHSKNLIDMCKTLKIVADKSIVDKYVFNDKADKKLVGKVCDSSGGSEMTNVQQVASQKVSNTHNLTSEQLEGTRNCNKIKDVEKSKSIIPKNKSTNASKNLLIGKDTKVIVRTFNMCTKRHMPDSAQKTSGIIFPSKCQVSNNSNVNFDTKNIVISNLDTNSELNLETQNTTSNYPQPVKLNWNCTNNEYFIVKDLPWKRLQPKKPNICPYCSRCLVKTDAQTQTDFSGPKSGIIIGRVDLDSSNIKNGAVKYIPKDLKNLGKFVYVNRGKILNGHSNNASNNFKKILPQSSFRIIYDPNFINGMRKENLETSNMSDSHSSGHVINAAGSIVGSVVNAAGSIVGSTSGSSEVVTGQVQASPENTRICSLSDSSQDSLSKNVNLQESTDQHVSVVNESNISSEGCSEENVITDLTNHNCDYTLKSSSVKSFTSNHISGIINSCKDNVIKSDMRSSRTNLVEDDISSCKDNLIEVTRCNTSQRNPCETVAIENSTEQQEYFHELENPSFENNIRSLMSPNSKNNEVIYEDNRIVDSFSAGNEKPAVYQDKIMSSVMWPPAHGVVQKKTDCNEIRRNKLMRTLYEDWLNCQKEDEDGNLPLHKAVLLNNIAAVTRQTIILKALDGNSAYKAVNHQNKEGDTALMIAAGIPDIKEDIVAILVHKFYVDQTVRNKNTGNTALHIASSIGNTKCVTLLLLAQGVKEVVDLFNDEGLAPLHLAAQHGHSDIIRALVESEAEINLKDKRGGYTPLYHAWNGDHKDACNVLMGLGAECSDAYFPDQLSNSGSDFRALESAFLTSGRKRKQKPNTEKRHTTDKVQMVNTQVKKGKYS